MQNFALEKNKYDFQLFKDLHTLDNNLDTCFEIFVLEKVKNIVELNGENIQINNRIVLFVSPLQKKKLNFDIKKTKGISMRITLLIVIIAFLVTGMTGIAIAGDKKPETLETHKGGVHAIPCAS